VTTRQELFEALKVLTGGVTMWLFEVIYVDFDDKVEEKGQMKETRTTEWVVAHSLQEVHDKLRQQIDGVPRREWEAIRRHVPICQVLP
jgi:hypothetical protein